MCVKINLLGYVHAKTQGLF